MLTQFIGGMPPAAFLFLVGVTLAFLMESRERQGLPAGSRVWAAVRRAGYLFGIAFLVRLQLWAFGLPGSRLADLFRVDILNAMGFAILAMSGLAVFSTADRVRMGAILGLFIAFAAPVVSLGNWSWLPGLLKTYLVPDSLAFGFFPWGAFVAFGISTGSVIRLVRRDQLDRVMQWTALLGLALILAAAYLWTQYGAPQGWSWVRQFGTTSLLVYWVHTELVYGRWLYVWKERLTPSQTACASLGVILLMLLLSVLKTNWKRLRLLRPAFFWPAYVPRRVPGD